MRIFARSQYAGAKFKLVGQTKELEESIAENMDTQSGILDGEKDINEAHAWIPLQLNVNHRQSVPRPPCGRAGDMNKSCDEAHPTGCIAQAPTETSMHARATL